MECSQGEGGYKGQGKNEGYGKRRKRVGILSFVFISLNSLI